MTTIAPPLPPALRAGVGGSGFDPASLFEIGDSETQATLVSMFLEQTAVDLPELRREGLELALELIDALVLAGAAMNAHIDEITAGSS